MFRSPLLEDFTPAPVLEATESGDYATGYEAGLLHADTEARLSEARAIDSLAQGLSDLAFTYSEAKLRVMQNLEPFFEKLAREFLPQIEDELILARLQSLCQKAAEIDCAALTLLAHPTTTARLAKHVDLSLPHSLSLSADPRVPTNKLLLRFEKGETALDVAALTAGLREALLHFTLPFTEAPQNDTLPLGSVAR